MTLHLALLDIKVFREISCSIGKKVKIQSSNRNCANQYFQIKTIPSLRIEGVVGAEFPEPPTSSFLTSSWIGTQVLDIINKYKNRKRENVSLQVEKQNKQKKSHQELSYLKLDLNASIPNIQQIKRKKRREIQKQKKRNISLPKVQIQNAKRATYQQLLYLKLDCNASTPHNQQIEKR